MRRVRHADKFAQVDFLKTEIAERLADRLLDIDRTFGLALDLHAPTSQLKQAIPKGKVEQLISNSHTPHLMRGLSEDAVSSTACERLVSDDELLPFANHSLDAILSNFHLHWVNDLLGTLIQSRRALKPDGLFLAALPGPRTLQELREAMMRVAEDSGKAAPRIAPFVEVRDAGGLLQRAGYALPVVDSEFIHLTYRNFSTFLAEIQMMGESNVLLEQFKGLTTAHYWKAVEAAYEKKDGLFPVTVEVVFMTAWSPHESQQKPLARGSAKVSLKDAIN